MNMMKWLKNIALTAIFTVSFSTQAAVITDVVAVNELVTAPQAASWTHNLNNTSFTLGSAQSATLSIEFWDDENRFFRDGLEFASIIVGTIDFRDGSFIYVPTKDWMGSLGLNSLASLNTTGLLDVTVWSTLGDFYIGNSTLNVTTASVPEPGTVMLLLLGLLGLAAARKTRA